MTKQEFEKILGHEVTQQDYNRIEFVYNFHPSIPETGGKETIAKLYEIGGMRLIKDMLPTAVKARSLEEEIHQMSLEIARLKETRRQLAAGTLTEMEESRICSQ